MEEQAFAEEALRDLDARGWRSGFAEAVVLRLAGELSEEFGPYYQSVRWFDRRDAGEH